ncbi:MAG TPA: hypothetical protein VHW70_06535 [Edaphobacter sp.]|nr:hypothetical protein [Edaphobacter sp.]
MINRAYRLLVPVLAVWLVAWIILSWGGVQDDAFIHLRYAGNLFRTHRITYDGVHSNYGASSLLYVSLLAFFRGFTSSPALPRVVSSCIHVLFFAGLVLLFLRAIPRESHLARLLGLTALILFVAPSAVRWLDDGMETGLVLCFVALLCWAVFRQSAQPAVTGPRYLALAALGFFAVLLRIELILLCGLSFVLLAWPNLFAGNAAGPSRRLRAIVSGSHLLLGGLVALTLIRLKMHFLLPDTALAKSSTATPWSDTLVVTAKVLGGALSFGAGMLLFWLLTLFLLWRARRFSMTVLMANSVFPVILVLALLRGQQVQGARYFDWTFCFSILWNILELGRMSLPRAGKQPGFRLAYAFLALLVLVLPYESKALYPMLKSRSSLERQFESNRFELFQGKRGVAVDVGYIGYFSQADICDLAGLVNGREKARETASQRAAGCAASHPDFLFFDAATINDLRPYLAYNDWRACSQFYDFKNVNSFNLHYLIVPRASAPEVCRKISNSVPVDIDTISH